MSILRSDQIVKIFQHVVNYDHLIAFYNSNTERYK